LRINQKIALNRGVSLGILVHHHYRFAAIWAFLGSHHPIRKATTAVGVQTRNERDWLVHDQKANSAIELFSHIFYLLLEGLLLFFFFGRRYLF